jgi:hypothetical protein
MSKMLAENRIKDSKKLEDHLLEQGKGGIAQETINDKSVSEETT